jgi:hypothetical protein
MDDNTAIILGLVIVAGLIVYSMEQKKQETNRDSTLTKVAIGCVPAALTFVGAHALPHLHLLQYLHTR